MVLGTLFFSKNFQLNRLRVEVEQGPLLSGIQMQLIDSPSLSLSPSLSFFFFCFNLIKKRVAGRESYDAHLITLPSVSAAG